MMCGELRVNIISDSVLASLLLMFLTLSLHLSVLMAFRLIDLTATIVLSSLFIARYTSPQLPDPILLYTKYLSMRVSSREKFFFEYSSQVSYSAWCIDRVNIDNIIKYQYQQRVISQGRIRFSFFFILPVFICSFKHFLLCYIF